MKLCRFDHDRVGLVHGDRAADVTEALGALESRSWPVPHGDQLIEELSAFRAAAEALESPPVRALADLRLLSPVANPSKIIGAPVNYERHLDESRVDKGIHFDRDIKTIDYYGLFLKSGTSLVGPSEGVALRFTDRRNDHEVELAAVIGRRADRVSRDSALEYVAGYAIGLDMTVRGTEARSFRKSIDTYSVLGPWLVTADEIGDPGDLDLELRVNGELRQSSNTKYLIFDLPRLIEYASSFYTLYPGDILMTGTPEGVGPVRAGDVVAATIEGIGSMTVAVRDA
ncbi:MAG TPA: fumarylacetoacetate hydrolase family protein [Gammaproteobacteria bacterium]|jgi:2-keto-4-pentenoate hydratase/2-oxohepta-3-ene-1,7-dioic acid hydratase in catechol pathway